MLEWLHPRGCTGVIEITLCADAVVWRSICTAILQSFRTFIYHRRRM